MKDNMVCFLVGLGLILGFVMGSTFNLIRVGRGVADLNRAMEELTLAVDNLSCECPEVKHELPLH